MEQDQLAKMFELTQKAQGMERIGNEEKALEYYLEIHRDYSPNTSKLFENPIRILEKKRRFSEAKELCEKAIDLVSRGKITGSLKTFEEKLERINKKMEDAGQRTDDVITGMSRRSTLRILVVFIAVLAVMVLLFLRQNNYDDLEVDLSEMEQSGDIQKEGDPKASTTEKDPEYIITSAMMDLAENEATMNIEVKDIVLSTKENTLAFALIVDPTSSEDRIKEIVSLTLETLGGAASAEYADLKGPNAGSLGQIFDYYDVIISVGESPERIIMKGTKSTSKRFITWHD